MGDSQLSDNMDLTLVARQARWNSERWFPELHDGETDMVVFYCMGLIGEAGEVANLIKKGMRKSKVVTKEALGDELADVFTYLLLLADENGIDLIDEFEKKQKVCEDRWGGK